MRISIQFTFLFFFGIIACQTSSKKEYKYYDDVILLEQSKIPWMDMKYDSVITYMYRIGSLKNDFLIKKIMLNESSQISVLNNSVKLDSSQTAMVLDIMNSKPPYNHAPQPADCFNPHHLIVFYQNSKPIADITICIMCSRIEATPKIERLVDVDSFKELFKRINLPVFRRLNNINAYQDSVDNLHK